MFVVQSGKVKDVNGSTVTTMNPNVFVRAENENVAKEKFCKGLKNAEVYLNNSAFKITEITTLEQFLTFVEFADDEFQTIASGSF